MCCSCWVYRGVLLAVLLSACGARETDLAGSGGAPIGVSASAAVTAVGPEPGPNENADKPGNPHAGDPVAAEQGHVLFNRYNCSGCHGDHGGGGMGPSLRDETWLYGSAPSAVFSSIAQGRSQGMPAWGTKVPEQQVWELVTYIKSLRTAAEPSPPDQSTPAPPMPW